MEVSGAVQEGFRALKIGGGSVGWRRKSSKWRVFSLGGYVGVIPGPTWKPNPDHSEITTKTKNLSFFKTFPSSLHSFRRGGGLRVLSSGWGV